MKKVKSGISILHNNATNCTFLATDLDEKVQTGTRGNDKHIEWMGDLTVPVKTTFISKDEFVKRRTKIISNMLDNPDHLGIYPTSVCFKELDDLFDEIVGVKEANMPGINIINIVNL